MNEASVKKEMKEFKEEAAKEESLEDMLDGVIEWHKSRVASLEHMLHIPQGIEVSLNNSEPIVMTPDIHKGFIIGITVGLIEAASFPIVKDETDEDAASVH